MKLFRFRNHSWLALLVLVGCSSKSTPTVPDTQPLLAAPEQSAAIEAEPAATEPDESPEPAPAEFQPSEVAIVPRTWTDRTGQFHVHALYLACMGNAVHLRKDDSHEISVPLEKLSEQDQAYLRSIGVATEPSQKLVGRVVGLTDADMVTLLDDNLHRVEIRLEGIDAPELGQAYGARARQACSTKLYNQRVQVEWREKDRNGRPLGQIYLDGRWINKELVQEGWAWHFKRFSHDLRLADAENAARIDRVGLWDGETPIAPWDFREQQRAARELAKAKPKPIPQAPPVVATPAPEPAPYVPSYEPSYSSGKTVSVKGYYRKDGTYVAPYTRSAPRKRR